MTMLFFINLSVFIYVYIYITIWMKKMNGLTAYYATATKVLNIF